MSYQTYNTEAIVCGSYDRGSANRSFLLFTRDAGMLYAEARSVREERSRQRYALQDFSLINVSLVKGKGGWRIGSVEAIDNPFLAASTRRARATVTRVVGALKRFVHGSEAVPTIYADLVTLLAEPERTDLIEPFLVRTFYTLGYVPDDAALLPLLMAPNLAAVSADVPTIRLASIITTAESASQL